MTAKAASGTYVPHGLNEANKNYVSVVAPALAAADTLDVTLPTNIDPTCLPTSVSAYTDATPNVRVVAADLIITNHNQTTGVTRLTAANSGVAAGSIILLEYLAVG